MSITFCDISEFQGNFEADPYIAAGHGAVIVRVHNGFRQDHMMPVRRDYCRGKPFKAVGWYQYLTKSRDAAAQARVHRHGRHAAPQRVPDPRPGGGRGQPDRAGECVVQGGRSVGGLPGHALHGEIFPGQPTRRRGALGKATSVDRRLSELLPGDDVGLSGGRRVLAVQRPGTFPRTRRGD